MKKLLLIILIFSGSFYGYSQNPIWITTPNYIPNIETSLQDLPLPGPADPNNFQFVATDYYDGFPSQGSAGAMSDASGILRFFVIDGLIYDEVGKFIDFAFIDSYSPFDQELSENSQSGYVIGYDGFMIGQETIIVPTADCRKYIILSSFTTQVIPFADAPSVPGGSPTGTVQLRAIPVYCIYDVDLKEVTQRGPWFGPFNEYSEHQDNPSASVPIFTEASTSNISQTNGDTPVTENIFGNAHLGSGLNGLMATDVQADGSRFLVSIVGDIVFVVKAESNGNLKYWKRFTIASSFNRKRMSEAELVYNGSTSKFQLAFTVGDFSQSIVYCEFSNDFLTMINTQLINLPYTSVSGYYGVSGLEFSNNDNYLYFTNDIFYDDEPIHLPAQGQLGYVDVGGGDYNAQFIPNSNFSFLNGSFIESTQTEDFYVSSENGLYTLFNTNTPANVTISANPSVTNPIEGTIGVLQTEFFNTRYYPLPDQIDRMDYTDHFTQNLECCIFNSSFDQTTFVAQVSETWRPNNQGSNPLTTTNSTIVTIRDELRIPAGKTVTIKNMIIKFAPTAKLIIENGLPGQQGGKLYLDNTTLTVDLECSTNSFWQGVEVWGNQNQLQGSFASTSQGVLRLLNGSRIEHALIGALASKRISTNTFDDSRNGGIIQANAGSVFFNNKQGVFFRKHLSPNGANNASFFTKTTFTWYGPLKENAQPRDHIKMDQVKGINIRACAFNQVTPELYSVNNQGYGINATLSQFYVSSQCNGLTVVGQPCPSYTPTTFTNLRFGVFAYFANSALSFSVNESEFNNCRYGVYSSRSEDARVTNNQFMVRRANYQTAGCLFDYSDGYKIEGNNFVEMINPLVPNNDAKSYGVWINNSGVLHNEVYRNTFRGLTVGGQSDRINASNINQNTIVTSGLTWKCNGFSGTYQADLGVNGVIDHNQGIMSPNSPTIAIAREKATRNVFSQAGSNGTEHDIMVFNYPAPLNVYPNQQSINYVHLNNPFHIANDVDNLVVPQYALFGTSYISPTSNMCPSKLGSTSPIKKSKMEFHKSEIANLYTQIDGGNTADLLNKATNFANENTTYQALMDASPYLSDEVLLAYIENSTISGKTKNVVVANSKLSPVVYQAVIQANLPNGVKNFITNAQDQVSERQLLYSEIKWNSDEYAYYFNDLTSELLLDTTELADYTPLINELNLLDDKLAKVQLLDVYVELRNATLSEEIRDDLDSLENPDYIELTIAIQELNDGLSNEKELNENETLKNQFINLRNNASCNMVSNSAKNILSCVFGVEDAPDFLPLQASSSNNGIIYTPRSEENTSEYDYFEVKVSMYPNPSTGQVYFDLPDFEEGALQIQLFDVTGKEVYSVNYFNTNGELVDFTSLKKGTYIVRITLGNDYNESHLLQLND